MVTLPHIAQVLVMYQSRYQFLDAFVDDVEELRYQGIWPSLEVISQSPRPVLRAWVNGNWLRIEIFPTDGVARFRLSPTQEAGDGSAINAGAAVGGLLGGAIGAAASKKEGVLGGLVLGMLVGGLIGAAAAPVERALALQFDGETSSWNLYDGPLLGWAKNSLIPRVPA